MASETLTLGGAIPGNPREALRVVSAVLRKVDGFLCLKDAVGIDAARKAVFPRLAVAWDDRPFCERLETAKSQLVFLRDKLLKEVM